MKWYKIAFVLVFIVTPLGCQSVPLKTPIAAPQVVICCIGGLGSDQTTDIAKQCRKSFPTANVISMSDWNGYASNPPEELYSAKEVVLIGHSLGGGAALGWAMELNNVKYIACIDPILLYKMYTPICNNIDDFSKDAPIVEGARWVQSNKSHNQMPHDAEVIKIIVAKIKDVSNDNR